MRDQAGAGDNAPPHINASEAPFAVREQIGDKVPRYCTAVPVLFLWTTGANVQYATLLEPERNR